MNHEEQISAEYQRKVGDFVNREVIYCVSTLVSELLDIAASEVFVSTLQEDLFPILSQDDWETAAEDNDFHKDDEGSWVPDDTDEPGFWEDAQSCCEANNLDPYQIEAYEHWIVSNYLADKLESAGEMILRDFMGLTIWGRATTGQAIHLDSVICGIYNDLQK